MADYKKILVRANTGGIGDFVWATSAISLVKQYDTNIKITLITSDIFIPLIDKKIGIDSVIVSKKKYNYFKNKVFKIVYRVYWCIKNYFNIKKEKYDLIIFLDQCYITSFFAKYLYKIKNIVGPSILPYGYNIKNNSSKFYTEIVNLPLDFNRLHCMVAYQLIIRRIFPTYNLSLPILPNTEYLKRNIEEKYLAKVNNYKIALCLAGSKKSQNWDVDNFKKLIEIMEYKNITFFIVGNNFEINNEAQYLINNLKNCDIINLVYKTSLLELKEFLNNIDLLISVDTGTVHIAATTKVKIISLYGSSLPERTMPITSKSINMCTYEKCSPCVSKIYSNNQICKDIRCMNNISPEKVLEKVEEILNEQK